MSQYPEHKKLAAIRDQSQAIGEFIDTFLEEKGIVLAWRNSSEERLMPRLVDLLAEYFGIDPVKLETEKRAMLDELRKEASKTL